MERTVDDLLTHEETLLATLTPDQRDQLAGLLRILLADLTARAGTTSDVPGDATPPDPGGRSGPPA